MFRMGGRMVCKKSWKAVSPKSWSWYKTLDCLIFSPVLLENKKFIDDVKVVML